MPMLTENKSSHYASVPLRQSFSIFHIFSVDCIENHFAKLNAFCQQILATDHKTANTLVL